MQARSYPAAMFVWKPIWRSRPHSGYSSGCCLRSVGASTAPVAHVIETAIPIDGNSAILAEMVEGALARGDCAMLDPCITDAVCEHSISSAAVSPQHIAASMFSALFFRLPHHPQLAAWAERARDGLDTLQQPERLILARRLLRYDIFFGRPARGALLIDRLQAQGIENSPLPAVQIQWGLLQSMYQDALGAHAECLETIHKVQEIASCQSAQSWSSVLHVMEINAYLGLGDMEGLRRAWEAARVNPVRLGFLGTAYLHQLATQMALADDNLPLALEQAEAALSVATRAGAPLFQALVCLSAVEVHLERGVPEAAEPVLRQAQDIAYATGSAQLACLCAFMRTYYALKLRTGTIPEGDLRLGFGLARRHGYRNFSWWSPRMMTALCIKALEQGVHVEYVQGLVNARRLVPMAPPVHVEHWPWPVKVYTLGRFTLLVGNQPVHGKRKAQHKPLELFKTLIAQGGRDIGEESLTSVLWPDAEGDAARTAFDTTLHRLRKLLGNAQALILCDRKLSLDPCICWVDSWAFERLLSEAETILANPAADPAGDALAQLTQRVQALYHGPFLGKESDAAWAVSLRERLRSRFLRHIVSVAARCQQLHRWEQAIEYYRKGLEVDDLAEQLYQNLILCHLRLGQRSEALSVYRQCRFMLSVVLGISPGPATEALYQQLRINR